MKEREDRAIGIIPLYKNTDGNVLFCLVQESDGHWGFPKGHAEPDESEEEAARRELREETGIIEVHLAPGALFLERYAFVREGVRYQKEVRYFVGSVSSRESITPADFKKEIPAMRWLPYDEARATLTFVEAQHLLDDVWQYVRERLE